MFEVYIHVPFCMRRCGYCDFNTYTAVDMGAGASRGNYANMVIREMSIVRDWQSAHGIDEPEAATVFFGGGTPTILKASDLVAMLNAVRDTWSIAENAEITTEANPDTVNADYVKELADGGFNRISFGMQSAVPSVLKTLDRTHTPANVAAGVAAANAAGMRSSVDLIYGAPGESLDDWRTSVRTAIDLGVNHISAYALTVAPNTKMGRQIAAGTLPTPDDDDEATKYEIADDLLGAAGLEWYEISNWARPGYESQHNLGYWRNVDWAGLGPGAHSHYGNVLGVEQSAPEEKTETVKTSGLRSWDIAHPRMWGQAINAGDVPWSGSERISKEENLEEIIMLGLRMREGLDLSRLGNTADMARIQPMEDEGLIVIRDGRVIPTRTGRLLNDTIIERFFDACSL
ncbi:radical SAM family heme chaperone HemW [Bifidobacterium catenulatum]|uniref:radical SAM family heme chaperone HemW n=1 Tax=Bifidobacterium TaxID=1678 RepID=UPI001166C9E9|nr:radical SAM family heme chaperone HemW [Bifidobacterium catenulatum]MDB1140967.1 radical SAM family heme chaperone HemW [Bifidobacterium catenulatum]MDB1146898.1 radical SAM family heme chaperone HemW [Bifidobacterium catenulatum]MDB1157361.1 radical SAM family heme chaperone HemW [Bifidobacterium catenulatum]VUX36259.1 Oxygen-independent coproporphyrinogen-III oxidase 1 [Bifidobacterium catenulatum]